MKMKFAVVSINFLIQFLISSQPVSGLNPIQLKPKPNIILIMADDLVSSIFQSSLEYDINIVFKVTDLMAYGFRVSTM